MDIFETKFLFLQPIITPRKGSIFAPVKNDYSNGKHCYSPFYN